MEKIRKLKGGNTLFVSEDEKFLVTSNMHNTVFVYDWASGAKDPVFKTRTISNLSTKALSPDGKLLAAKNTSGLIAVFSLETGEEILRNKMLKAEGYQHFFTPDGKGILDFAWGGVTMYLDLAENKMTVLDESLASPLTYKGQVANLHYDRYSGNAYKFVMGAAGLQTGTVYAAKVSAGTSAAGSADGHPAADLVETFSYVPVRKAPCGIYSLIRGMSFCREHNYHIGKDCIQAADKDYSEVVKIPLPQGISTAGDARPRRIYVSPCEKYIFFNFGLGLSLLYDKETMELVRRFEFDYVCDFTMTNEDQVFIISTWEGAFTGRI